MFTQKQKTIIFSGKVIKGQGMGKEIGFPTINLDRRGFSKLENKPPFGVYYGTAILSDKIYKAGIVLGPVDKGGLPKLEAHLIGFFGNARGMHATIEIKGFIREFRNFKSVKELSEQIQRDIDLISNLKF